MARSDWHNLRMQHAPVAADRLADAAADLLSALRTALPYVQKVANTAPTEPSRMARQRQAVRDAARIETIISGLLADRAAA